VEKVTQSFNSF